MLKIYNADLSNLQFDNIEVGKILLADAKLGFFVGTGNGVLNIKELQLSGGKRMSTNDFLRGKNIMKGEFLGGINE
jgi:methionyl-tRNA formyltransferase